MFFPNFVPISPPPSMPEMACRGREHRKLEMNRKNRELLCVFKELYLWKWRPCLCMCVGFPLSGFMSVVGCMLEPTSDCVLMTVCKGARFKCVWNSFYTPLEGRPLLPSRETGVGPLTLQAGEVIKEDLTAKPDGNFHFHEHICDFAFGWTPVFVVVCARKLYCAQSSCLNKTAKAILIQGIDVVFLCLIVAAS